ncbi:MAG: FAD-dependent monooxygenase [Pseudomonadota bacterium]
MDNPRPALILTRMTPAQILIVGGSLNGATLALALAQAGIPVTVIDGLKDTEQTQPGFDGRSYALALASVRMLTALGLWPQLADDAQAILDVKVSDGHAGRGPSPFVMHFDHAEIEEGPLGHMVEDRHLRRVLLAALADTVGITHVTGKQVIQQEIGSGRAIVTLNDGQVLDGHLLVGADGRRGKTGPRAGLQRRVTDYGQTALVCALSHERPHNGCAHQFFMPEGPLAILPLKGNRSSIVWTERHDRATAIQALDDATYLQVLRPRFGDFLGALDLAGDRYCYPLNLVLSEGVIAERVALVGDAARGVHPIAGQGLNAGLRDVAALSEVLATAARRGEDIGRRDVLERYRQWRRFDTASLALATDTFNRLFSNDNPLLRFGRDIGMGMVNAVPRLRRSFIREAAGLNGDLPLLLRGKPL